METTLPLETKLAPPRPGNLSALLSLSGRALFAPARFFREDAGSLTTSESLTLGVANAWLAGLLGFVFSTLNSLVLARFFDRWVQRLVAADEPFRLLSVSSHEFLWEAGLLLLAPFLLLLRVGVSSLVLFLFSRLLIEDEPGAPESVTYASSLRIQGASLVSQWFLLVPFVGGFLSFVVHLVLTVTGVRERYQVSSRRAAAVVLAPYVLLFLAALLMVALAVLVLSQIPFQDLLDPDTLGFAIPRNP